MSKSEELDNELEVNTEIASFKNDLSMVKRAVDSLQIVSAKANRSWYQEPSVLIAFLALMFSLATTYYSSERLMQEDLRNARSELRELTRMVANLPREALELEHNFGGEADGLLADLNHIQALYSSQIIHIGESYGGHLSTPELIAVSMLARNSGDIPKAITFAELARNSSQNFLDETAALRTLGQVFFNAKDSESGKKSYLEALTIFKKYPKLNLHADYLNAMNIDTFINLATDQAYIGQCKEAKASIKEAKDLKSKLLPPMIQSPDYKHQFSVALLPCSQKEGVSVFENVFQGIP